MKPAKPKAERETTAAQLPRDLVDIAVVVAKYRKCPVADLLDGITRGPLEAMERQMADEISRKPARGRKG